MKKTFVTTMPDHVGAFLKASQCFAALEANITRVSYNKAVDTHTLFIEAEGTPEALEDATENTRSSVLPSSRAAGTVLLMEFKLRDVPGAVTPVLRLIQQFAFNISYISSQEDGSGYQQFKMGLFVEDPGSVSRFLEEASRLCAVRSSTTTRSSAPLTTASSISPSPMSWPPAWVWGKRSERAGDPVQPCHAAFGRARRLPPQDL